MSKQSCITLSRYTIYAFNVTLHVFTAGSSQEIYTQLISQPNLVLQATWVVIFIANIYAMVLTFSCYKD